VRSCLPSLRWRHDRIFSVSRSKVGCPRNRGNFSLIAEGIDRARLFPECYNAEFSQMRPQRIDHLGLFGDRVLMCPITGIPCLARALLPPLSPTRMPSGRVVILPPALGWYPDKIQPGGKQKLGPISKQGDRYLRRLLVVGAHAVLRRAKQSPQKYPWLAQLLARRPFKVVAIALANKMARVAWALTAQRRHGRSRHARSK
jgi:hypothetical protein